MLQNHKQRLDIEFSRSPVVFTDIGGWKLSYGGSICIYSLCFKNLDIIIDGLGNDANGNIKVRGLFREDRRLSSRISLKKNGSFELIVNQQENSFSGFFMAILKLFKNEIIVKVFISDSKFLINQVISLKKQSEVSRNN